MYLAKAICEDFCRIFVGTWASLEYLSARQSFQKKNVKNHVF